MEILRNSLIVTMFAVVTSGCVHSSGGFWRTDKDLDKYRQSGGISVSSPSGLYNGILEKVSTNTWKQVFLQRLQFKIEIPEQIQVSDVPDWTGISLWTIRSYYPDARYAAQVIIRRKSKERYEEDLDREKRIGAKLLTEGQLDTKSAAYEEWRNIKFHSVLEVDEYGTLYRLDIRCSNGDVLEIEGMVEKLTDRKTGQSLYPEMDTVIRRIINSIEPLRAAAP